MSVKAERLGAARERSWLPRVLGRVAGRRPGPLVVAVGGIHGNEPAGPAALERVLPLLQAREHALRGVIVALAGNREALTRGVRYVEEDLNRIWFAGRLRGAETDGAATVDAREQAELWAVLSELVRDHPVAFFLDLHTSSAEGPPFVTVGDTLANRAFSRKLPLPRVLGLEEQVDGALLEYLNNLGWTTLGVEGGAHDDPAAVSRLEAVSWLALEAAGALDEDALPRPAAQLRRELAEASSGVPRVLEIRYRHPVAQGAVFRMRPGFRNFDPVRRGALLAEHDGKPVLAPWSGRIVLPLYQGQGSDGFFLARPVGLLTRALVHLLRRSGLGLLARVLPGVRPHPRRPEVLVVDTRIARFYALEILHLFGYRKLRRHGASLLVERRREPNRRGR